MKITSNEYRDYIQTLGFFLNYLRTYLNEVYFKNGIIFPYNPDEIITSLKFTEG